MVYDSVWCFTCRGTEYYRRRDEFGFVRIVFCKKCHGGGRLWTEEGSQDWELGKQVIKGLWPNNPNKEYR